MNRYRKMQAITSNDSYSHAVSKKWLLISTVLSCMVAGDAFSQETERKASAKLPELEVVGSPAPEQHRLEDAKPEIKVTREQFEGTPASFRVKDVIKRMPGVFTGGAPGEDKDVRLRGLDKEFTRVEFDGVQLPDGGEKRELNIDRIPNSLVDEVKIIRNSVAEYEADGIAGRVHIETRPIPLEEQIEAEFAVGNEGSLGTEGKLGSFTYGNRFNDKFGLQGTVSYFNDPLVKTKQVYRSNGIIKETESEDKPTEYINAFWDAGVFYDEGEIHIKPIYLRDDETKEKLKSKFNGAGAFDKYESEDESKIKETAGLGFGFKHRFSESDKLDLDVGYYHTTEDKDKIKKTLDASFVEDASKRENEIEDKTDKFWQLDAKMTHDWNAGFDNKFKYGTKLRFRDRERSKEVFKNGVPQSEDPKFDYQISEDYYAVFIQNEAELTEKLTILPGLRAEYVDRSTQDGSGSQGGDEFLDVLPSVSANYRLNENLAFNIAGSRVVNRPKFDELSPFENTNPADKIIIGNPNLDPARAWAFDAGFDYVRDYTFFGFNAFYRDIKDVIESRPTGEIIGGKTVEQVQNVGNGYLRGIELEQRVDLAVFNKPVLDQFSLTFNESFIDSEVQNADGSKTPFKEQPDFIGNIILDWKHPTSGTSASIAGNYVSKIDVVPGTLDGRESEFFVDARIAQEISPGVEIYLLAENLTDEGRTKSNQNGETEFEETGRYFYVGTSFKF